MTIVDPRLLNWNLLQNLGIAERPKRVTRIQEIKIFTEAIPALKEVLAGLIPIEESGLIKQDEESGHKFNRIFLITSGKAKGKLLGVANQNGPKDSKKIAFVTTLHNEEHRLYDIRSKNLTEIAQLQKIRATLNRLSIRISPKAKDAILTEQAFNEALANIIKGINELEFVQDEDKKTIRDGLIKLKTVKDVKGRKNVASKRAILASIGKYISNRIRAIGDGRCAAGPAPWSRQLELGGARPRASAARRHHEQRHQERWPTRGDADRARVPWARGPLAGALLGTERTGVQRTGHVHCERLRRTAGTHASGADVGTPARIGRASGAGAQRDRLLDQGVGAGGWVVHGDERAQRVH